jgi:hypothetical protein
MYAIALPTLLSGNARCRNAQAWIALTIAMECSRRTAARSRRARLLARRDVDDRTPSLHGVELPDEVQDLPARRRIMRLGLHEFAAGVGPAVGEREGGAGPGERVVAHPYYLALVAAGLSCRG